MKYVFWIVAVVLLLGLLQPVQVDACKNKVSPTDECWYFKCPKCGIPQSSYFFPSECDSESCKFITKEKPDDAEQRAAQSFDPEYPEDLPEDPPAGVSN